MEPTGADRTGPRAGSAGTSRRCTGPLRVLGATLLVLLVAFGSWTAPVGAQTGADLDGAEAASLARRAITDDDALAELRAAETVDGRPVDLSAATSGVEDGPGRRARLEALAAELELGSGSGPPALDPQEARSRAEDVLDQSKFSPPSVPRPFKGVLEWLGDRLDWIGGVLGDIFSPVVRLFERLPGGRFLLLALFLGAVAAGVFLLARRRSRTAVARAVASGLVDLDLDPAVLDDRATEAEGRGELAAAVRLRYEAGLIRLHRADRLVLRAETTAADAARQVDDPAMDRLTTDFEQVVYGGRSATGADVERARDLWPRLTTTRRAA